MATNMRLAPAGSLVTQFISVATKLCMQLQGGLAEEASVDPLQVIVMGCLTGRIPTSGEINGVRYCRHGFGAWLRSAKASTEIAGTVDIDVKYGELDRPYPWIFHAGCIRGFARSLNLPEPSELQVERACIGLVHAGVLHGTSISTLKATSRWSYGHWSFDPNVDDPIRPKARDVSAKRMELWLAVERLGPPQHKTKFQWDEVRILNDAFKDDW